MLGVCGGLQMLGHTVADPHGVEGGSADGLGLLDLEIEFAADKVLDGKRDSYWSTPEEVTQATLVLDLPPGRSFDLIRIREHLPLGIRVT